MILNDICLEDEFRNADHKVKLYGEQDLSLYRLTPLTAHCPSLKKLKHKTLTFTNADVWGSAIDLPVHLHRHAKNNQNYQQLKALSAIVIDS